MAVFVQTVCKFKRTSKVISNAAEFVQIAPGKLVICHTGAAVGVAEGQSIPVVCPFCFCVVCGIVRFTVDAAGTSEPVVSFLVSVRDIIIIERGGRSEEIVHGAIDQPERRLPAGADINIGAGVFGSDFRTVGKLDGVKVLIDSPVVVVGAVGVAAFLQDPELPALIMLVVGQLVDVFQTRRADIRKGIVAVHLCQRVGRCDRVIVRAVTGVHTVGRLLV